VQRTGPQIGSTYTALYCVVAVFLPPSVLPTPVPDPIPAELAIAVDGTAVAAIAATATAILILPRDIGFPS
jgi:hypothetical protein